METVGVSGLVQDGAGQVLLIRTAQAGWELPGGRVEAGEDLMSALKREALEETGYTVDVGRLAGVYAIVPRSTLILVFRCSLAPADPMPVADENSLEARWFSPTAALAAVTHPNEHQRLADAIEDAPGAVYRAIIG